MKKFFLLTALLCTSLCFAEQMPIGYYDDANGKADAELMEALHQIIRGGERYNYGSNDYHTTTDPKGQWKKGDLKAYGTWWAFQFTDLRSDGTIWDMYSQNRHYLPIRGGSTAGMEIEHCFPKSWWGAAKDEKNYQKDNAYRDLYHLNPSDKPNNTNKSNYPPGNVKNIDDKKSYSGFKMGTNEDGQMVFEPEDEYKGDFARAYFYIATAYKDTTWALETSPFKASIALDPSTYQLFKPWLVETLLGWHRQDPVSEKELRRLDAISSIQHNRNPYIEYPELVEYIWGNKHGETLDLSTLVRTTSDAYVVPVDKVNPETLQPSDINDNGFTAQWKDQDYALYTLDVYTESQTGSFDTLINIPGCSKEYLFAYGDSLTYCEDDANGNKTILTTTQGITDGTYGMGLGTTSKIRYFEIANFDFGSNVELHLKCAVSKSSKDPLKLIVKVDNKELKTITLTRNDTFPVFNIPDGAKTITIAPAVKGHVISMQQIFLVRGNYRCQRTSLDGYPRNVEGTSFEVIHDLATETQPICYTVTPVGLDRTSNAMLVPYDYPTTIPSITEPQLPLCNKVLRNGQLFIQRQSEEYSILGTRIR